MRRSVRPPPTRRLQVPPLNVSDAYLAVLVTRASNGHAEPRPLIKRHRMDARAKTVRDILHSGDQYLIPFFQRHYSWKLQHWQRLWDDLRTLADDPKPRQHFLGPLVCTP